MMFTIQLINKSMDNKFAVSCRKLRFCNFLDKYLMLFSISYKLLYS